MHEPLGSSESKRLFVADVLTREAGIEMFLDRRLESIAAPDVSHRRTNNLRTRLTEGPAI